MSNEQTALATRTNAAMATYQGVDEKDTRGKEQINQSDVKLPFLAIAQKTSPEIETGNEREIEGLKFLGLFNSLTREVVAQPVEFLPIILKKHAIEFNPYDEGGGIKDRNVPWDDDRCEFHGEEKPVATRFYDWAVLLVPSMELIVLSMKSTNISTAKQFQQLVQLRKGPAFAGKYRLEVVKAGTAQLPYGKFKISPAGAPDQEQYEFAAQLFESIKDANWTTDNEAVDGGAGDPAPAGEGKTSAAAEAAPAASTGAGKIPF